MKKQFLILMAFFISFIAACCPEFGSFFQKPHQQSKPSFVKRHGQLSVIDGQLVNAQEEPIVLRGVSLGWHNWWSKYWNKDVVRWLRDDWHCTVLRAAMGIEPSGAYMEHSELADELMKTVVEACIESGIYVIIDWHDHHAPEHIAEAKIFFTEMAQTYGQYPHIIYEIYNEPVQEDWVVVKDYADTVITAIRQYDPDNIILIGTTHWSQDLHIAADNPLTDHHNVMYTLHFYAQTHRQWLRDRGDYALAKGLPVFVSESDGSNSSGQGDLDMEEWNLWIEWMESNKISWIKWSISDKQETCSSLKPNSDPKGGWKVKDLTESGIKAREFLRRFNQIASN